MGQQQLLLLILSAVIVGVAIVMGINMFAENAGQANQDAVMQDCLTLASRAQSWYRRPAAMGGGNNSYDGATLAQLNFNSPNENGSYAITPADSELTIVGVGNEDPDNDGTNVTITVIVGPAGVDSTNVNP